MLSCDTIYIDGKEIASLSIDGKLVYSLSAENNNEI